MFNHNTGNDNTYLNIWSSGGVDSAGISSPLSNESSGSHTCTPHLNLTRKPRSALAYILTYEDNVLDLQGVLKQMYAHSICDFELFCLYRYFSYEYNKAEINS